MSHTSAETILLEPDGGELKIPPRQVCSHMFTVMVTSIQERS